MPSVEVVDMAWVKVVEVVRVCSEERGHGSSPLVFMNASGFRTALVEEVRGR